MGYFKRSFSLLLDFFIEKSNLDRFGYLPRWAVFLIDISLVTAAFFFTELVFSSLNIHLEEDLSIISRFGLIIGTNALFFFVFKTYSGIIRHSNLVDLFKLGLAAGATLISLALFQWGYRIIEMDHAFLIQSILFYSILSFTFQFLFRIVVKQIYQRYKLRGNEKRRKNVAIYGVGAESINLGQLLISEVNKEYKLKGFISLKAISKHLRIAGKPVLGTIRRLEDIIKDHSLDGIIVIGEALSVKEKKLIVNRSLENKIQIFNAPLIEKHREDNNSLQQIKSIEIQDLLEREPIQLEESAISKDLGGKIILITGAAGSIGSGLVRQIAGYNPKQLILIDQAETPLHALELELLSKFPDLNFIPILSNISDNIRMNSILRKYEVSVIYHAAAYKHVPLAERNPREAILTNLSGSINMANLAIENRVQKFVMISTDKAVNPTNVMGASKRASEMYVQSLQTNSSRTQFITTRFGNVLGSNGSVIPHFKEQITVGGPITVTHPDITRYFMTIPEACQLVLQAGTMGRGGEIFVFDMGKPVKIIDLAKKMIKLAGLEPFNDIDIKIIGLRPGEKLYEELLNDNSKTLPTHNRKIMIARDKAGDFSVVSAQCDRVIKSALNCENNFKMIKSLKILVPEFRSNNSEYEKLDNELIADNLKL